MTRSQIICIIFSQSIFIGCGKETFKHSNIEIVFPCICCEKSNSIEGVYIGRLIEVNYVGIGLDLTPIFDTITDSIITFPVTRIYENDNTITDSLVCKFEIPRFFEERIELTDNSGQFAPRRYSGQLFTDDGRFLLWQYKPYTKYDSYISLRIDAIKQ